MPSTSAARTSAYASTTHCSEVKDVFRSAARLGSATFTIVTLTSSMNVPVQITMSGSHLRIGSGSFRRLRSAASVPSAHGTDRMEPGMA